MKFHFDVIAPLYEFLIPKTDYNMLDAYLRFQGDEKVLEIGGGTGRLAHELSKRVKGVYALDPSLPMLRIMREKERKVIPIHGYAEDLPFDTDFFDMIIVHDSLHHWDNQERGLREAYRVLKQGGKIFIGEIHPSDKYGHFIVCMEKSLFMGSRFYLPSELKALLTKTGFHMKKWGWIGRPTYFIIGEK